MQTKNLPIQMLCCCNADGDLQPLRFRFEDAAHLLHTVQICEILDCRKTEYVGIEAFFYLCRALLDGAEKLYELKYTIHSHKWVIFRELY